MSEHLEKPPHITQGDWNAVDVPAATDAEFAQAKPFRELFPDLHETWKRGRGRPKAEAPKLAMNFRLSADVVKRIKETGKGYNARVEKVLREALEKGQL